MNKHNNKHKLWQANSKRFASSEKKNKKTVLVNKTRTSVTKWPIQNREPFLQMVSWLLLTNLWWTEESARWDNASSLTEMQEAKVW